MTHPEVVGYFHDHGRDADGITLDVYAGLLTAREVVHSTDPLRLEVTPEIAGDELTVTIDGTPSVIDVRPRQRGHGLVPGAVR